MPAKKVPQSAELQPVVITRMSSSASDGSNTGIIFTGDHTVSNLTLRLNKEWQPKDKSAQRFKDDIVRKVEQILNNTSTGGTTGGTDEGGETEPGDPGGGVTPDLFYDSGYFYIRCQNYKYGLTLHNNWYATKKHNLGQIPTRMSIFWSNVQEPVIGKDSIVPVTPKWIKDYSAEQVGFTVSFISKDEFYIAAPGDRLFQSGYSATPGEGAPQDGYLRVMLWR